VVAATGCDRGGSATTTATTPPSTASSTSTPTSSAASASISEAGPAEAGARHDYATAAPVSGKSIGHTSVVFKLKLDGGLEAAYKPRSRRGRDRYRGEIAAYRVGIALGLNNVPTALPRSFSLTSLQAALGDGGPARELFDKEVVADSDGQVPGALMPWIPKLEFLPLEGEPWRARWNQWLASEVGPGADELAEGPDAGSAGIGARSLAAQMSTMVVFDYLTGNWDRWSGGQIGIARATGTLLFLDNDGAFFDPPPAGPLASQLARLIKVWRFSRGFVGALRTFDPVAAKAALGDDGRGVELLTPSMRKGLEERRKRALAIVDAKIAERGEASVLAFP
jgi:hypothetical protein